MRFSRPARPAKGGLVELGVPKSEKVLATATESGSAQLVAVATNRALYLKATGERIRWDNVAKAVWDEPMMNLTLVADDGQGNGGRIIELGRATDLPAAIHDRVTASVIVSERADLGDGAAAMLVARRNSDSGQITWSVVFETGLDPKDPALITRAAAELAQLRESLGI